MRSVLACLLVSIVPLLGACSFAADTPNAPTPPPAPAPVPASIEASVSYGFSNAAGFAFLTVTIFDAQSHAIAVPITVSVSSGGVAESLNWTSIAYASSITVPIDPYSKQLQATVAGRGPIAVTMIAGSVVQILQLQIP